LGLYFQNGKTQNFQRLKKGTLIVSPSWIQKCEELQAHAQENDYLIDPATYVSKKKEPQSTTLFDDDEHSSSDVDLVLERGSESQLITVLAPSPEPQSREKIQKMVDTYAGDDFDFENKDPNKSKSIKRKSTRSIKVVSPSPEPETEEPIKRKKVRSMKVESPSPEPPIMPKTESTEISTEPSELQSEEKPKKELNIKKKKKKPVKKKRRKKEHHQKQKQKNLILKT